MGISRQINNEKAARIRTTKGPTIRASKEILIQNGFINGTIIEEKRKTMSETISNFNLLFPPQAYIARRRTPSRRSPREIL